MNETIRDRIKRQVRTSVAVSALAAGAWLILFAAFQPRFMPVAFVLVGLAMLPDQYALKCPRCLQRIARETGMRVAYSLYEKSRVCCSHCGVSFDEPCSPSTIGASEGEPRGGHGGITARPPAPPYPG